VPPRFLEQPSKHAGVARLVGTLAGEVHADFPILARKITEIARGAFEAVDFLVHLAVQELHTCSGCRRESWRIRSNAP
jgi:hypothetical protein